MIILDEQLTGREIDSKIRLWYHGKVCYINDLRPQTVIKDEAIPSLLAEENQATFVTINVKDFWHTVPTNKRYCVVCIDLPDSRVQEVPQLLRRLRRMKEFSTKNLRAGKVVRIAGENVIFYDEKSRRYEMSRILAK